MLEVIERQHNLLHQEQQLQLQLEMVVLVVLVVVMLEAVHQFLVQV